MSDTPPRDPPSPFVTEWIDRLRADVPPPRRALDVAMGRGRHLPTLAAAGCSLFGVDIDIDAVHSAVMRGVPVRAWVADLTAFPLPERRFDVVVVTRYLQRDLFPALDRALTPGGLLLYETFLVEQRQHGRGPTSRHHLLHSNELRERLVGLETVFYEEVMEPDAVARIVARRVNS
jgi:SAM-dependent methyltransferase